MKRIILPLICAFTLIAGSATASASPVTWRYTDSVSLRVNPIWEVYVNNAGLDLLGYPRDYAALRGGSRSSVKVYLENNDAFGWRMRYYVPSQRVWRRAGFNMLAVAHWQGERNFGHGKMKNWGVYYGNFRSPGSWRAAYILRIR